MRQQNRDLYELPLAMRSLQRWEALSEEIGLDLGFRRSGILYGTQNEADVARWGKWGKQAKQLGFVSHLLSASEAQARLGEQRPRSAASGHRPTDAWSRRWPRPLSPSARKSWAPLCISAAPCEGW
nr:FAD dependent oxidoreductase [Candidatus Pantoea persica]